MIDDATRQRILMGAPLEGDPGVSSITLQVPDRKKCVVLVPVGSSIEPDCETSLQKLERLGYPVWRVRGYSAIDQGRNQMATDAMAQGFEETMWIDSDVGFDPADVDRLRCIGLPILCGIYPKKGKRELAIHVMPGTQQLRFGARGCVTEIKYAATGFLHVRREVYETIQRTLELPACNQHFGAAMVPYFMPMIVDTERGPWYIAEDYSFCERARRCGFKIMADTRIRLTHIGSYKYSWEDAGIEMKRYGDFIFNLSDPKQMSGSGGRAS